MEVVMLVVAGLDSLDSRNISQHATSNMYGICERAEGGRLHTPSGLNRNELITQVLWPSMLAGSHPKDLFPTYFESVGQQTKEWNTKILDNKVISRVENKISSTISTEKKQN